MKNTINERKTKQDLQQYLNTKQFIENSEKELKIQQSMNLVSPALEIKLKKAIYFIEKIDNALNTLSDTIKNALVESYIKKRSLNEVTKIMAYSHSSICRYKKIGLKELSNILYGDYIYEN